MESEDQADAACGSVVAMETEPPLNKNNSRNDKSDAIPSCMVSTDSSDGVNQDEFCYTKGKGFVLFINNFENAGEPRRKGKVK